MNRLSIEKQAQIAALLVCEMSVRGTAKTAGVTLNTVLRNLLWLGDACQRFHDTNVRGLKIAHIQADEMWSFVYAKDKNVGALKTPPPFAGSIWTWLAIDPSTRFVPSWWIGGHEVADAQIFMNDLAARIPGNVQISTDQLRHYPTAVEEAFGDRASFATVSKKLAEVTKSPDGRFEPQEKVKGDRRVSVFGNPDLQQVNTYTIESLNSSLRHYLKRYGRDTKGFSRRVPNLRAAVALHFAYYNFCRIHPSISVTPAMEVGLTKTVWEIEDLVERVMQPGRTIGPNE